MTLIAHYSLTIFLTALLLYQHGIYGIGTIRKDRKHMPSMVPDKAMKRGDHEFQYSDKAISCKWFDNRAVRLLGSNVEGFDAVSVVSCLQKGAATKVNVSCPAMVKIYNYGMDGVDLMDQYTAAYRLDRRERFRFYLRIFSTYGILAVPIPILSSMKSSPKGRIP